MAPIYKLTQTQKEIHKANIEKLIKIAESGYYDNTELLPTIESLSDNFIQSIKEEDKTLSIGWTDRPNRAYGIGFLRLI